MTATPAGRVAGLDTLRALAIALVLAYHHRVFVSGQNDLGAFSEVGWVGVDLFFVLSGYLIGTQILGPLHRGEGLAVGRFYGRRLLRTVPAYWAMLALYFSFPGELGGRTPPPLWRFLSFTQNIGLEPGTAFSHAWSLCIEEQFYLALPLLALAFYRRRTPSALVWAVWGATLLAGIVTRGLLWVDHSQEVGQGVARYHPVIYYASWCRADEFLPGLGVALLQYRHPALWAALMARGRLLLAWALAAVALVLWATLNFYYIDGVGYGWFMTTFGYSLIALVFGLLLLAALSPTSGLHVWRVPGAAALAAGSYSIYLSHKAVAHGVHRALQTQGVPSDSALTFVLAMLACLAGGALLYRGVERPFLNLRQRWLPARPGAPG